MKINELPKVAIVGRPNVGKSSIYNRIIGKRESIIDPTPGVTRDRHYRLVEVGDHHFLLVDTGGITYDNEDVFADSIKLQSEIAISEADLILFIVEMSGFTEDDYSIAETLRKSGKDVILVVNKCDNPVHEQVALQGYELGLGTPFPLSAMHGSNFYELLDTICQKIPAMEYSEEERNIIRVSIVGRPNVGKSSLLNRILNEERSLVSDIPGTTRDPIKGTLTYSGFELQFMDTAGMRRKSRVHNDVEYYSVNRAVKSIEESDLIIMLIDSAESITEQDKKIVGLAIDRGRAVIIAVNKWDLIDSSVKYTEYVDYIRFKFSVANYMPVMSISALTGLRVSKLIQKIIEIYEQYTFRVDTNELNDLLQKAQEKYIPSTKKGRLKIYYGTQIKNSPPRFLLFINRPELMTKNYKDYITNQLRNTFHFNGVPIFIYTRKSE